MNAETESQPPQAADLINTLRRFHYGEPAASAGTEVPAGAILPALLNPYRDARSIRYQYPLYLAPVDSAPDAVLAKPMGDHLRDAISDFAPGEDQARMLKDNLAWLERYLRQKLTGPDPVDAPALFDEAAQALQTHLELGDSNRDTLAASLQWLRGAIAEGSQFLGYGPDSPLHLLVHAIRHRDEQRDAQLRQQIAATVRKLEGLLQIEAAKSGAGAGSSDPASGHIDTSRLSSMLQQRAPGSKAMAPERLARITAALQQLKAWDGNPVLVRFVGELRNAWLRDSAVVEVIESADPCSTASEIFEQEATSYAKLFAALRIAALEEEDKYDPAVHDSWFASFDWQAFSDAEIQSIRRIVALVSADHLAGDGLPSFSRLLGSRLPVHVISWVRAYDNPAVRPGEGPFDAYRFELAYLGVGHRQVVVAQTSAARHEDMLAGFQCALESNRTSLHLINRGTQTKAERPILDPWFVASAALESRAHPFLLVNPSAGDHAAERVVFGGNPQPDRDWPLETLEYKASDGTTSQMQLAFTFADYALLMPALHQHFRMVPAGYESEELVPVADYLALDPQSTGRRVPFVWGIDENGALLKLVVSRALVFACRDRLNYWRTLQEFAGIHNFYVEAAIEKVLEDAKAAAEAEREELLKEHAQQLESVRSEAAGEAMGQLVDVLMGADLSSMVSSPPLATMPAAAAAPAEAPKAAAAEAAPAAQAEPEPEEEEVSFDEPWLDTPSCTTCDDCIKVNKAMFAYNGDKQAYLKDPRAGTYAELVAAAEVCPAKAIHPGKPLDPNEPGLQELIARAAPFN